jgi:RNA polymerase sigma-70 factor (ECF subfamily)
MPFGTRNLAVETLPLVAGTAPEYTSSASALETEVMTFFSALRQTVFRYIRTFDLPIHDSEEIAQEVFFALFRHLQMEKPRGNLQGWIFRVAHNLALKRREANGRMSQMDRESETQANARPDSAMNSEERIMLAQRQKRLLSVVSALNESDKYCLRLRAAGLHYRKIAELLGISLGSVSLSLRRSFERLARVDEK